VVLLCGITALFQKAEPLLLELTDVVEMKNCLQDCLKSSRDAEDFIAHTLAISAATADLDIRKEWQTHIQTSFAKTVDAQGMEKLQAPLSHFPLPLALTVPPLGSGDRGSPPEGHQGRGNAETPRARAGRICHLESQEARRRG
jgi:hypothetical protein